MADNLVSEALARNQPAALVQLLKDDPRYATIRRIRDDLCQLAFANPSQIDALTTTLATLKRSDEIPEIQGTMDGIETNFEFADLFQDEMYETITTVLYRDRKDSEISLTNNYIVASILSASAIHADLCVSSAQIGELTEGLHFTGPGYEKNYGPEMDEILAVGACIHVLMAGRTILATDYWVSKSDLKEAISSIGRVAKCEASKRIIKATQDEAENDFQNSLSSQSIVLLLQGDSA